MTEIAIAATKLAYLGRPVLPLHAVRCDGRCSCGKRDCSSPGKHPRTPNGLHDASADLQVVAAWWSRWRTANLGLRTGESTGLLVIDLDGPDGIESFEQLQRDHESLPPTRWVCTGGGGRHAYLRHPAEHVANSVRRLGPGVDVRADNAYVVAPPSNHISGRRYEWANSERAAPCPAWLLELLRPVAPTRPPAPVARLRHSRGDYGRAALADEEARVRMAPTGTRNHALNVAAFSLGQLVGSGLLDLLEVAGTLLDAAMAAGLGEVEAQRTIESGLAAGQAQPRGRTA